MSMRYTDILIKIKAQRMCNSLCLLLLLNHSAFNHSKMFVEYFEILLYPELNRSTIFLEIFRKIESPTKEENI